LALSQLASFFTFAELFYSWRALCFKMMEKRVLASPVGLPAVKKLAKSKQGFANCEKAYGQL